MFNVKEFPSNAFYHENGFIYESLSYTYAHGVRELVDDSNESDLEHYKYYFNHEDCLDEMPECYGNYAVAWCVEDSSGYWYEMRVNLSLQELKRLMTVKNAKYKCDFYIWNMDDATEVHIEQHKATMTVTEYFYFDSYNCEIGEDLEIDESFFEDSDDIYIECEPV